MMRTPVAEVEISDDLVRRLLADQHPDLASRPLGRRIDGWDNAMFRLGHDLAVRLPRRALGAEISAAEHEHLPVISQRWTFPAPVPLRLGAPAEGFPWEWSVVPWIDGDIAFDDPLTDLGARDLGVAIAQIQQSPTAGAPHNPYRSGTLPEVAELFDTRLNRDDRAMSQAELIEAVEAADLAGDEDALEDILEAHSGDPGSSDMAVLRGLIDAAFAGDDVPEMLSRMETAGDDWSARQVKIMKTKSPTALVLTAKCLRRGGELEFEDVMRQDLRVSMRCLDGVDFYEGVRAVIIDKDNAPNWSPAGIGDVDADALDAYFEPLPADKEMKFLGE